MFLYTKESLNVKPRLRGASQSKWRRRVYIIASPNLQTKEQYLESLRQYYNEVILPQLLSIETAILEGSEPDYATDEQPNIVELPAGWRWAPIPLPEYKSWPQAVDPECIYRYLLAQSEPKMKSDIAQALGVKLSLMERAFGWLREQSIVVPYGVWHPDGSKITYNLYGVRKIIVDRDGNEAGTQIVGELPILDQIEDANLAYA